MLLLAITLAKAPKPTKIPPPLLLRGAGIAGVTGSNGAPVPKLLPPMSLN